MPKFKKIEPIFRGATFDDFLFSPQKSILETRADPERKLTEMFLTKRLKIRLPIIAANMRTVTGTEMMKTMSLEGGFAFLPRDCSINEQVSMLRYVKRQHSFIIENPLVLPKSATIGEAKNFIKKHKITGILVEEQKDSQILAGILSRRDLPFNHENDNKLIAFVMTPFRKLITANAKISLEEAEAKMHARRVEKLPLIDGKRKIRGLITMKDLRLSKQKPYSSKDRRGQLLVGAAVGVTNDYLERTAELIKNGADCILIDIANFHSVVGQKAVQNIKAQFGGIELIGGNIATYQAAKDALNWGVDAVKVGIGPGRGCRTRIETNFGVPQLQAIREVYLALKDRIPVIADGGMSRDGHIFLAIAAGASTVMLGSMLAGTDESPGIVFEDPATGQKKKIYRGSTAPQSVIESSQNGDEETALSTPQEGQSLEVRYRGSVVEILERMAGHLMSSVSYSGYKDLKSAHLAISKNPSKYFQKLSPAAQKESFER